MLKINSKFECCGCTACANSCPKEAIAMEFDEFGFLYPRIDMNLCVDCGLCEKVCQFHDDYILYENFTFPAAFQFRMSSNTQLLKSQSGGAFFAIADLFIADGGIVYGAAFTDSWRVVHQRATNSVELDSLRMSKYVQSDIRGIYSAVRDDLSRGIKVLFSGTPCQVAGLKSYLPDSLHRSLFCIDLICHGVPSPQIWKDYLAYLQTLHDSKIVKICFRDKRFGWHGARESYLFENGHEDFRQTYNNLYFSGYTLRESCSKCVFTNLRRIGDISIGDHWDIPKDSIYEDGKGLSLVFVNSEKGQQLFDGVKDDNITESVPIEQCGQPQLHKPSILSQYHLSFKTDYMNKGFVYVAKRYGDLGLRYKIIKVKEKIKHIVDNCMQK